MNSNFFKMNLILPSAFLFLAIIVTNCQAAARDYFSLAYDGAKYKMTSIGYSGEPSVPDPTTEYEAYFLVSGTKVVSNINCLQWYSSPDEFISDDDDISYEAVIDNLLVTVGSDERSSSGITVSTSRYNPYYLSMKLDMEVGDSYSQSYTAVEQSSYGDDTSSGEVMIEILAIESIDTFYGSYPDTLKFRVTETTTVEFMGITYPISVSYTYWMSSSAGQVRTIAEGDGFTDTVDYLWEELTSHIVTDTDGDGIMDSNDNCPLNANPSQTDSDSDGIGDACDLCFGNDATGDTDQDNVCNNIDNCDAVPNSNQVDVDHDGVGDVCDNCINLSNPDQANSTHNAQIGDPGDVCDTTDSDNDGISDMDETQCSSDPSDPHSKCIKTMPWLMLLLNK